MSTRMNGLFPCARCTLLCQPTPAPNMHTTGNSFNKHIVTEPLSTIRSHFTAKNLSFTMDSSTQLEVGKKG